MTDAPAARLRRLASLQTPPLGDGRERLRDLARAVTRDSTTLLEAAASHLTPEDAVRQHLEAGGRLGGIRLPPRHRVAWGEDANGEPVLHLVGPDGVPLVGVSTRLAERTASLGKVLSDLGPPRASDASGEAEGVEEMPPDADLALEGGAFDVDEVWLLQAALVSRRMAGNLVAGRRLFEGVDVSTQAFSLLANQVASGVGDLAGLAIGPAGAAAGVGARVALQRARHRHGSASALVLATQRVRAAVES